MDGLLTDPRPEPARHSSPAAVLGGLDVVEMRHLLVEEGVADGARGVFGRQHEDTITLDEPRVEAGASGPGGGVGREPQLAVLDLNLDSKVRVAHLRGLRRDDWSSNGCGYGDFNAGGIGEASRITARSIIVFILAIIITRVIAILCALFDVSHASFDK